MINPATSYYSSRSAVMTDVGICVGMRNVDLNTKVAASAYHLQTHRRQLQNVNFNNACLEYLRHQALYNGQPPSTMHDNRHVQPQAYQHGASYLTAPHFPNVSYGHSVLTESVYVTPPAPPVFSGKTVDNVHHSNDTVMPFFPTPLPPRQRAPQPKTTSSEHFEVLSNRLTQIRDRGLSLSTGKALRRRASFESPGTPCAITVAPKKKWMRHYMSECSNIYSFCYYIFFFSVG